MVSAAIQFIAPLEHANPAFDTRMPLASPGKPALPFILLACWRLLAGLPKYYISILVRRCSLASVSIFATATDTDGMAPGEEHGGWSATGFGSRDVIMITAKAGRTFIEGEHGISFSRVLVVENVSIETRSTGGQITYVVWCSVRNAGATYIPNYTISWAKVSP